MCGRWATDTMYVSGECRYCQLGITGRCVKGASFGSPALDGSQAEYFKVPLADSTLLPAPVELGELVILMTDIFPTGFGLPLSQSATANIHPHSFNGTRNAFTSTPPTDWSSMTIAIIGCGPVAVCALICALDYKPARIFAVDSVPAR